MALTKITANVIEAGAISTASLADTSITAAKLATTLDLTGKAITVATASAGDNDTTVASTAFVTTAIANLTDSAPAALDTLNELAAALNDDADFSTTVTNSIATKLPLAGGTLTGNLNFGDSDKAIFGAGSDLQIYHDSNNSIIEDAGTGHVQVRSGTFTVGNAAMTKVSAVFNSGTSQDFYYNNVKKFETTSTGIDVTGTATMDGLTVNSGATDQVALFESTDQFADLALKDSGGTSYIRQSNGSLILEADRANASSNSVAIIKVDNSEKMRLDSTGVGIGTTSPQKLLHVADLSGSAQIMISSSDSGVASLQFSDAVGGSVARGYIEYDNSTNHLALGTGALERLRVDSSGNVGIGTTSPASTLDIKGDGAEIYLRSADYNVARIIPRGTGANLDKGLLSLFDTGVENVRIDTEGNSWFNGGNVGIGTNSPFAKLHVGSRGSASVLSYGSSGDGIVFDFYNLAGSPYTRYANIVSSSSDTSESRLGLWTQAASGTSSEKLTILGDGKVGIGQTSPQAGLDLGSSAKGTWSSGNTYHIPSGNAYIKVQGTAAQDNWIGITGGYDQSSGSANLLLQANIRLVNEQAGNYISSEAQSSTSADITFGKMVGGSTTSGNSTKSEFMRIDSSGNFLVGKTSADNGATVGLEYTAADKLYVTDSASSAIVMNRLASDGNIANFQKDGTTVGSIATRDTGALEIGSGDVYLQFNGANDWIKPVDGSGNNKSGVDLGTSGAKFDNLYLSGTASIGNLTIAGAQGTDGQLLTSTGSGIAWEDAPAGGPTFKTFGTDSIMIGDTTTGTIDAADNNVGLGVDVFAALTSGDNNVAIGKSALKANTTGNENVAVGIETLFLGTAGIGNTAVGRIALRANTSNNNTAVGNAALTSNTSGSNSVAIGAYALQTNTTSSNNTAVGRGALLANTAADNTAVGYNALASSTTATQVTALGFRAGEDSTANSSTFIGYLAGAETTTGSQNTFIGASTAESGVCTGTSNTAVGGNNFTGITTGSYNCVMGTHAMRNFQTGEGNVVLGYNAKRLHSSGDDAVVIGNHAGYNMTTGRSVVVGNEAFYDGTSTDDSVFIGNQAGYNVTTGYTNIIIGDRAGDTTLTTGYSNVIIGYKAGRSTNGFANTFVGSGAGTSSAGSYNTCIGNGANFGNANNGGIIIGQGGSAGAAGTYATLAYGSSKSWISLGATGWSGSSDKRLKENIRPSEAGLSFINDLTPVNFDWRKKKDIDSELETHKSNSDERYEKDNPIGKIGFIAQDVKEALDNHPEVISHLWEEQEDGTQALTPNELIPMLVKAVQELSAKVEELQNG